MDYVTVNIISEDAKKFYLGVRTEEDLWWFRRASLFCLEKFSFLQRLAKLGQPLYYPTIFIYWNMLCWLMLIGHFIKKKHIHVYWFTKDCFCDKNKAVIDWQAKFLDLNPIENIWSILAKRLHRSGKQITNISSINTAKIGNWRKVG